jgi:hypothetical protein
LILGSNVDGQIVPLEKHIRQSYTQFMTIYIVKKRVLHRYFILPSTPPPLFKGNS